jgi:hypothetical protein
MPQCTSTQHNNKRKKEKHHHYWLRWLEAHLDNGHMDTTFILQH